ncbi:hypothetical protein [Bradyrhizobium sp. USDA 4473]
MTDSETVDWLDLRDGTDASERMPGLVVGGIAREHQLFAMEDAIGPPGYGAHEILFTDADGTLEEGEGLKWQAIMGWSREPTASEVEAFIYSRRSRLLAQHHANIRAAILRDDAAEAAAKTAALARSRRPPVR